MHMLAGAALVALTIRRQALLQQRQAKKARLRVLCHVRRACALALCTMERTSATQCMSARPARGASCTTHHMAGAGLHE